MKLFVPLCLMLPISVMAAQRSPKCERMLNMVIEDTKKVYDLDARIRHSKIKDRPAMNAVHQKLILQQMHSQANYETSCTSYTFDVEEV